MVSNNKQPKNSIKSIFNKVVLSVAGKKKEVEVVGKKAPIKRVIQDINMNSIKKVLVRKVTKKNTKVKKSPAKKIAVKKAVSVKKKKVVSRIKGKLKKRVELKTEKKETLPKKESPVKLKRMSQNPIISPSLYGWESEGAFNPTTISCGGKVHLFYRALGADGISRIGYAVSNDGINFNTRLTYPVYVAQSYEEAKKHWPYTSPARLVYDPSVYTSGGSWGGCEDPRAVLIDGVIYMTFNVFNGWHSLRVAVVSIKEENLLKKKWIWENFSYLSRLGDRQKNWVLFPEKINGKFAIFCNLDKGDPNKVFIFYVNNLDTTETPSQEETLDPLVIPDHQVAWHYRTRSIACPPIKTKDGWLILYHAMDKKEPTRYKVGAMLLDLNNPEKVLYRSNHPILEPDLWYENDYKPGIVYVNGSVVKDDDLYVYYGGGDKHVCVASIKLQELIDSLKEDKIIKLKNVKDTKNI